VFDWYSPAAKRRAAELEQRYGRMAPGEVAACVERELEAQAAWVDRGSINLNAASNLMNPRAERVLSSTAAGRPSLGHAGEKYETGLAHAEVVEHLAQSLAARLFGARYVEFRALSGAMANLFAYMALAKPGDAIISLSPGAGGHATHQTIGTAGLYGLRVHAAPWDPVRFDVDVEALSRLAARVAPRIILVGGSLVLRPYDLDAVAAVARGCGAALMFDAAHVGGLIAGGVYPAPLEHGADLMTMSTYKTYGGPPGGLVLTNDMAIAQRLDAVAFPGMTANFDVARVGALAVATADLLEHGAAYARATVANAQALAAALEREGFTVLGPRPERTQTHHVAVDARALGGGDAASLALEPANVLATGIGMPLDEPWPGDQPAMRLGTQEVTRVGMGPAEMERIAGWMARALLRREDPVPIGDEVRAFRAGFQEVRYVLDGDAVAAG